MSWFSIPKAFTKETKAKAAEVNENFDAVATALNGLFQAGHKAASAKPTVGTSFTDIAGTEVALTLTEDSLLIAIATFDATIQTGDTFLGTLNVDGAAKAEVSLNSVGASTRETITQSYCLALAEGAHTLKLQCKRNGTSPEIFSTTNTGLTYLVIPEP